MANPLYSMLMGQPPAASKPQMPQPVHQTPAYNNPLQQFGQLMQAMRNPAAFVQSAIPDLPQNIANDPNRILNWMKQNLGITDAQIQQAAGMIPRF